MHVEVNTGDSPKCQSHQKHTIHGNTTNDGLHPTPDERGIFGNVEYWKMRMLAAWNHGTVLSLLQASFEHIIYHYTELLNDGSLDLKVNGNGGKGACAAAQHLVHTSKIKMQQHFNALEIKAHQAGDTFDDPIIIEEDSNDSTNDNDSLFNGDIDGTNN
ncbi:hypothetical protein FQN52_001231 [Onygenales sp. PD_12]|nr:hypothetical protein FQN52_001231 [Onygenales sp. PD_12]